MKKRLFPYWELFNFSVVRIIARRTLKDFWDKHADVEQPLRAWFTEVKRAKWESPQDIRRRYKTASILRNNRVVFNIKGNRYRLVVSVRYDFQIVYVRFIGTHQEYDRINAEEI